MKNNKGFTLIEIIATIGVLLLIATITIPSIITIQKNNKEKNYEKIVSTIETAAENYYHSNLKLDATTTKCHITLKDLANRNLIKTPITNPKTNEVFNLDNTYIEISATLNNKSTNYKLLENVHEPIQCPTKISEGSSNIQISESLIFEDTSGANKPVLVSGMIPVVYDDKNNVWVKADTTKGWYAYQNQIWANAVTVTSENRVTYKNAEPGTVIPMDDINSMWVWIPRFKYKITSNVGSSSAVTTPPKIDVIFETGVTASGVSVSTSGVATTEYYTHPAFRNGSKVYNTNVYDLGGWNKELTGFWVAKFEMGGVVENPLIKPDIISLNGINMGGLKNACELFSSSNNKFGLPITSTYSGSHMIKNTEWGAVAYLSQSQYGKMGNSNYTGTNKEIYPNDSTETYTGRSSGTPGYEYTNASTNGTYSYDGRKCSPETCSVEIADKNSGYGASTTGTIYGVYDMSGGSAEYVMTVYGSQALGYSGIENFDLSAKHLFDRYGASKNYFENIYIPGDATWETRIWYNDWGAEKLSTEGYNYLIRRGGTAVDDKGINGIFNYGIHDGSGSSGTTNNEGNTSSRPMYIP